MICKHQRTNNWVTESNTDAQRRVNMEAWRVHDVLYCQCSHVLLFVCRSLALKGWRVPQMFHTNTVWFHLLLWDFWQQDLWSVLQCQRVCAARLHGRVCVWTWTDVRLLNLLLPCLHRAKRCELFVQKTDRGTWLHVCSFPAVDVVLYVEMDLEVVERSTNTHLYNRTVCVEDQCKKCSF